MAYIRCVLDANEKKRVIVQNGQREDTCSIERHFPLVSRVFVAECVVFHLVLFSVRQSSEFLSVHAFSFEECQTANCER